MRTGLRILALGLVLVVAAAAGASIASAAAPLTASEKATLLSMREEEKLAHDVYVALAAKTGDQRFTRIAASEARHEAATARMLALYGIADPTAGYAVGKFPTMQALYDKLVAQGSASTAAALAVGVTIEKMDIADLQAAIAETDEAALDQAYGNLLRGSQRHLQAFGGGATGTTAGAGMAQRRGAGRHGAGGSMTAGSGAMTRMHDPSACAGRGTAA